LPQSMGGNTIPSLDITLVAENDTWNEWSPNIMFFYKNINQKLESPRHYYSDSFLVNLEYSGFVIPILTKLNGNRLPKWIYDKSIN